MSKSQKIILKLNEQSQISFNLSIEGYSTDASLTSKPEIRFALTEGSSDMGFLLPAKFEEGKVSVDIPSSGIFKENREYKGKLEVFLGNRYFKPAELAIEFQRPLEVKAEIVSEGITVESPVSVTTTKVERVVAQPKPVVKPQPKPQPVPQKPKQKPVVEKLDVADEIDKLLKEEEMLLKMIEKVKKQKQTGKPLTESEQKLKEKLKRLFRES